MKTWTKAIHRSLVLTPLLAGVLSIHAPAASNAVHQATGLKICEVDDQSAIIWTRLTLDALHLASMAFLRARGVKLTLASFDGRLSGAASALGIPTDSFGTSQPVVEVGAYSTDATSRPQVHRPGRRRASR